MDYVKQYEWLPNFKIVEFKEETDKSWKDVIRLVVHIEDKEGLFRRLNRTTYIDLHYSFFSYNGGIKTNILLKDWLEKNTPSLDKVSSPITPTLYESKMWNHILTSPYSDTKNIKSTKDDFRKLNIDYLILYVDLFFDIIRKNYDVKFSVALNRQLTIKKLLNI